MVIENAVAGCGCTTPEFPKNAIAPGASDKIKVTYNAASMGTFTKPVTVTIANAKDPIVLTINGEVVDASAAAAVTTPAVTTDKISTAAAKTKVKTTPSKVKAKSKS